MDGAALLAPGLPVLMTFDDSERERIRHGLNRYKELHGGIGDPELCERIVAATRLPVRLSTLQRFLKGKHRTDDAAVHRYKKFLQMVAPPPAEDELGPALLKFFHMQREGDGDLSAMAGAYATRTRPYVGVGLELPEHVTAWRATRDPRSVVCTQIWSTIHLAAGSDPNFLRATEHVVQPPIPAVETFKQKLKSGTELTSLFGKTGIFVPIGRAEYMMMVRSFVDARIYLLARLSDDPLTLRGIVYHAAGVASLRDFHWPPAFEIEMTRDAPSAASDEEAP